MRRRLEIADDISFRASAKVANDQVRNVFRDEPYGAVTHQRVSAADVQTEWLIVGTAVVGGPRAGRRTAGRRLVVVDQRSAVVGWAGNARTRVRIGPAAG